MTPGPPRASDHALLLVQCSLPVWLEQKVNPPSGLLSAHRGYLASISIANVA